MDAGTGETEIEKMVQDYRR